MPAFNLSAYCLADNLARWPDRPAVTFLRADGEPEVWSFAGFAAQAGRVAAAFGHLGLVPGDRVLLRLPTGSDAALAFFAAVGVGLVPITCSPMLTRPELGALAEATDAALLLQADEPRGQGGAALPPRILHPDEIRARAARLDPAPFAGTGPEDPAFLIFTSGTSGRPKGVLHAQRTVLGRRPMRPGWQGFGPGDRVLHAGQLNWTYTLGVGLMDPWAAGASAHLHAGPNEPARWPALIRDHDITVFAAVPTVYRQILKYGDAAILRRSALRHCLTAGEALAPDLLAAWCEATGRPLYEALGMSEISTYVSSGPLTPVRPGSPGRPQPGRRVAILPADGGTAPLPPGEVGLLAVHRTDPGLMLGYWRDCELTASVMHGDWFTGGDLAAMDEDGYVWFHGRQDDVLNCQGYRVSALEVERVLAQHPEVAEVAVGESRRADGVALLTAYAVPSGPALDADDLRAFAADRLAAYKCPRVVRFASHLPRTPNGKLIRSRLADLETS